MSQECPWEQLLCKERASAGLDKRRPVAVQTTEPWVSPPMPRTRAFLSEMGRPGLSTTASVAGHGLFWKDEDTVGRWVSPTEAIPRETGR